MLRAMGAYVIGVIRSATGLDALTLETSAPVDLASPWRVEHTCELRALPNNSRAELWAAWDALGEVTRALREVPRDNLRPLDLEEADLRRLHDQLALDRVLQCLREHREDEQVDPPRFRFFALRRRRRARQL
jgi:hypothetical protein